jgi:hypothetical protein
MGIGFTWVLGARDGPYTDDSVLVRPEIEG